MKIESLKTDDLKKYAQSLGLNIKGKKKNEVITQIKLFERSKILDSKKNGTCKDLLFSKIEKLANEYALNLNTKVKNVCITNRKEEMKRDDSAHYLIYRVLGKDQIARVNK